jgi:hypothetical protein
LHSGREGSLPGRRREPLKESMMMCHWGRLTAVWLLCALLAPTIANAHDLPLDRMMNAFVKIEPHQVDLVIRVPLDLLRAVPFPLEQGGRYDLAASGPAVETALRALASDFSLWEDGVRLASSSAIGHLAPLSDRSFEDYEQAAAEVAEPVRSLTIDAKAPLSSSAPRRTTG